MQGNKIRLTFVLGSCKIKVIIGIYSQQFLRVLFENLPVEKANCV